MHISDQLIEADSMSDAGLVSSVAATLAEPRHDPADSFVLHSALELVARSALLPFVDAHRRDAARQRIVEVGEKFRAFGQPVEQPRELLFDDLTGCAAFLAAAIDRGELDDIDASARWLGRAARPRDLAPLLADTVVSRLAAAGHAPIFLSLLPRVAPRGEMTCELLRGLCRELGRHPDWKIRWIEQRQTGIAASADELFRALSTAPLLGRAPSSFIFPLVSRVDTAELAAATLGPVTTGGDLVERGHAITRFAAWSMLNEPGDEAPYGWSHCLTMPQAVLNIAHACSDPSTALAVAATFALAFRVSLADQTLDTAAPWTDPQCSIGEAILAGPTVARSAAWHLAPGDRVRAITELASFAASHHDAHLVKYTLACFDAAGDDPTHAPLYLAAAATLAGWWAVQSEQV